MESYYIDSVIDTIRDIIERYSFGVCSYLGDKMGIASSRVRLYFMYLSFVTLGSPLVIYLILAFWLDIRRYLRKGYDFILH